MTELLIESEANARFKRWRRLAGESRDVKKEGATLLEGIHLMQVVRDSEAAVSAVMLDAERATAEARALARETAATKGARLYLLPPALYDQLSPVEHGVGVMCEMTLPAAPDPARWAGSDVLYLDGVQDAGNAGTLIRTAVAAGVRVILASPTAVNLWTPKVMRAAMGAHFGAVIAEGVTADTLARVYRGTVLAADARGGEDLFQASDGYAAGPVAWIMGAEGPGLSEAALSVTHRRFYIPIEAACESLNVAAAAAVCLFDMRRRRLGGTELQ